KADPAGEKQVDRVPPERIPPAPPLKPADALKSFKLQPGFRIELVANEPLVHDPVAMAFDPGRDERLYAQPGWERGRGSRGQSRRARRHRRGRQDGQAHGISDWSGASEFCFAGARWRTDRRATVSVV